MATNRHTSSLEGGRRRESEEGQSATTDGSGDHTHTFANLSHITSKADVEVQLESGRVANVTGITAPNQVTFRVFESAGSGAAMAAAITQAITYNISAEGY